MVVVVIVVLILHPLRRLLGGPTSLGTLKNVLQCQNVSDYVCHRPRLLLDTLGVLLLRDVLRHLPLPMAHPPVRRLHRPLWPHPPGRRPPPSNSSSRTSSSTSSPPSSPSPPLLQLADALSLDDCAIWMPTSPGSLSLTHYLNRRHPDQPHQTVSIPTADSDVTRIITRKEVLILDPDSSPDTPFHIVELLIVAVSHSCNG